jgi:hypothetical protein
MWLDDSEDEFVFDANSLGTIHGLRIRHDNAGSSPGWFVDSVTVQDLKTYQRYHFPCNHWLATDQEDGAVERELTEAGGLFERCTEVYTLVIITITNFLTSYNSINSRSCPSAFLQLKP